MGNIFKKLYAEVNDKNELRFYGLQFEYVKRQMNEGNRIAALQKKSLDMYTPELASIYAETDGKGNIVAAWNDKKYVEDNLLSGDDMVLLQEVSN